MHERGPMTQRRRAESKDVRDWDGVVAEANRLDEVRTWVVWGTGPDPERAAEPERAERPGEPGNEIARAIAAAHDPDWEAGDPDRWVTIVRADEDEIDSWVFDDESARGYAPYLAEPLPASPEPGMLRGVLRSDVVKRRKLGRFDAGRPD
jgi:hypothetical protein